MENCTQYYVKGFKQNSKGLITVVLTVFRLFEEPCMCITAEIIV